ncbi:hypothetical protein TREMEDRAFT_62138 [Tremella mesenterica DSM 1558]|uniref:uncharacterized protein n=1 Tax=Tremella mesenterica (strain ATCC 24925 / CBS 8224 / DSM 1558 / NBRC 9311 / NRRL Y-6157 / RJB 2259-6 / UBC 559-6) TaxID=578456 RepID=UPI0003F4A032|nr:uncharacterized protein TREMEDRAFT_62138 [Tremella mesenterica DSM 1558]EIW69279.1 hypothetical protein TREMEDRAFT_62138 [Tremella mesenterica DSM 1558]
MSSSIYTNISGRSGSESHRSGSHKSGAHVQVSMRLVKDQLEEIIIWNRLPRDPSTLGVLGSTWHPRSRPHSLGVGCFQDELANFSPNAILSEHASNSRTIRNMLHAAAAMWAKSLAHTWNEIRCVVQDTHNSRFEWMKVESYPDVTNSSERI